MYQHYGLHKFPDAYTRLVTFPNKSENIFNQAQQSNKHMWKSENVEQQQLTGKGTDTEQGVNAAVLQGSQILQGSSSAAAPGDVRVENSVIETTNVGAAGVTQSHH